MTGFGGKQKVRTAALLLALAVSVTTDDPASAADITVDHPWADKPPVVSIIGPIDEPDGQKFASAVSSLPDAIVALSSEGGNVLAALQIGETIRAKSTFVTVVPDKALCASSCALIWLAGTKRYIWTTAHLGVHGVFDANTMQESGPGNGIVGAYLAKLGLSYLAIAYITAAAPNDMTWMSSVDAKALGIDATVLSDTNPSAGIPTAPVGIREQAVKFVYDLFVQWNTLPEQQLMEAISLEYSNNVLYYNTMKTMSDVLGDKLKFIQRWPERKYQVRTETVVANCDEAQAECLVTGVVDWEVSSPTRAASSTGSARFSYYLGKVSPERFVVMKEDSVVLNRQTATATKPLASVAAASMQCVAKLNTARILASASPNDVAPRWKGGYIGTSWTFISKQQVMAETGRYLRGDLVSPRGAVSDQGVFVLASEWSCQPRRAAN